MSICIFSVILSKNVLRPTIKQNMQRMLKNTVNSISIVYNIYFLKNRGVFCYEFYFLQFHVTNFRLSQSSEQAVKWHKGVTNAITVY